MLKCISTAGSVLAAAANCSRILSHHHYLYHAQSFRGPHTAHLSPAGFARGIAWAKRQTSDTEPLVSVATPIFARYRLRRTTKGRDDCYIEQMVREIFETNMGNREGHREQNRETPDRYRHRRTRPLVFKK
ncbi:MAG TPA: hypothetical protein VFI48_00840, partial [Hyphomicrobiaceae bacterium]|nr:hypothetical protein [Hyphomicrobiaceae bacterium]